MPFEKGNSYGQGRPKGSENKETKKIREWITSIIEKNTIQVEEDLAALKPKERLDAIINLLEYSIPKLSRVELNGNGKGGLTINVNSNLQKDGKG